MKRQPRTSLIILTRNEISGLRSLIRNIPVASVDECFAVDYASTDGTREYFLKHHVPVITQTKPGRAEAFRLGAKSARGQILIFFSPDGNEDPSDIPTLIANVQQGADLAIASRFLPGSRNEEDDHLFAPRKWANLGFTYLTNLAFRKSGPYITDTINGYRAITKIAFDRLHLDAEGFAIEYQMTMRALRRGYRIVEIPTREGNRVGGRSGSTAIPTGLAFIGYWIRELFEHK